MLLLLKKYGRIMPNIFIKESFVDDSCTWYLISIFILLLLAAYFAGAEIALASVNRIRLTNWAEDGDKRAKRVLYILDHFDKALTTLLIGTNVTHAGIGIAMGNSRPELKEVAKYITKPFLEDGVAYAIDCLINGELSKLEIKE